MIVELKNLVVGNNRSEPQSSGSRDKEPAEQNEANKENENHT